MYIQITTRCNMKCPHCAYNCTSRGKDMSFNVFKAGVDFDSEHVSIGGGEPTLHRDFEKFLFYSLANAEYVWLATNGSQTETSLLLAKLAKKGVLGVALSIDNFHNQIDNRVIDAFKIKKSSSYITERKEDLREIRNVSQEIINSGRAKNSKNQYNYEFCVKEGCVCPELFLCPDGTLKACGCKDSPVLGNILKNINIPNCFEYGLCWKKQEMYKIEKKGNHN